VGIDNRDGYDYMDYVYGADAPAAGSVKGTFLSSHKSAFSPTPNTESGPLANLKVTRGNQTVFTGPDGSYQFAGTGAGTIAVSLDGPFCHIVNQAGASIPAVRTGADFSFNASGDEQLAQVTSFKYVNEVGEFTKSLFASPSLPVNSRPHLLDNLDVFVNLDETCNAFWDGESLNFFISGPCLDQGGNPTGEVGVNSAFSDVVFHEYGHGIDDALGRILDGGYSEGFGDAVAVLITRDHLIAPGWKKRSNGNVVHLRDAKNNVQWPDVQFSEVHRKGTAYGGFAWSLIENLGAANSSGDQFEVAKSLIMGAALRNPTSIPDAVLKSFLFDFESGGDHYEVLKAAAKAHGLPFPANRNALASPSKLSENLLSKGDPEY